MGSSQSKEGELPLAKRESLIRMSKRQDKDNQSPMTFNLYGYG